MNRMNETGDTALLRDVTPKIQMSSAAHSSHFIVKRSPEKGDNND